MTDKIEELIRLGDLATQGEWELWNSCSWNRFGIKHEGKPFIYPYINPRDGHQELAIPQYDAHFITAAANARDDIKALKAERDRLESCLVCVDIILKRKSIISEEEADILKRVKQALKQED